MEDPEGTARVKAALEAHTWPDLQLKATPDPRGGGGRGLGPPTGTTIDHGGDGHNGGATRYGAAEREHGGVAHNPPGVEGGVGGEGVAATATEQAPLDGSVSHHPVRTRDDALAYLLRSIADDTEGTAHHRDGERGRDSEAGQHDNDGSHDSEGASSHSEGLLSEGVAIDAAQLAAMESLFADMAAARETLHGLEDEDRRDAAAQLALRLAAMFGLEEEGGESEEE